LGLRHSEAAKLKIVHPAMPRGALTAQLSGVPWKPARQIAATENLYGRALNGRF